ncbi:MAG: histidine kinase [Bacteroidota bacterium]|nr:histidine kinase [Bacteroidota bacterium]
MVTKIALILSILLQFIAAIAAIRLTKVTKYNVSWILISAGFLIMAMNRLFELIPVLYERFPIDVNDIFIWMGFLTSLCFMVSLLIIRKIFTFINKMEQSRREAEKRLLNIVIQTEERERKRFASDLHDGLGPLLSTVKMSVSTLQLMDNDPARKEIIENTAHVVNESIKSIKEISNNLSPHILNNFGLASAIKEFAHKIDQKVIHINFESNAYNKRFDENIEVVVYRVVCELINNTMKHAKARNIDINLSYQHKAIILSYSDDGIGFDASALTSDNPASSGMGLSNMLSRINSIKGKMDVESSAENGTKVLIRVKI